MDARLVAAIIVALLAAAPIIVRAQAKAAQGGGQVVATAGPISAPQRLAAADARVASIDQDGVDVGAPDPAPVTDHAVHGEMSAGVGSRGYRELGGLVSGPLGNNGQVTIVIAAGQLGGRR